MPLLIIAFIVSLVPAVCLYIWLKKFRDNEEYKKTCRKALIRGMLATVPVFFCSLVLSILKNALIKDTSSILYIFVHNFFVLAFSEELCKMMMHRGLKKKAGSKWSGLESMIFMIIVGLGFEFFESGVYGLMTNAMQMLVRGITMMHAVFGMIMGCFMNKAEESGNRLYYAAAFVLPWLFHGLYDFSLNEEISGINDFFLFLPLILVVINMLVLVKGFRYLRREKKKLQEIPAAE